MEALLGHKSGILITVGAAYSSWIFLSYGKEAFDRKILKFLSVFFIVLSTLWLLTPYSAVLASIAVGMFGISILFLMIGGIPGVRISVPNTVKSHLWKTQGIPWAILLVAVIVWQKTGA
jgi:hypothetical protein